MKLSRYEFTITPIMVMSGGISQLEITVVADGVRHARALVIDDREPWENQLEHYSRIAVKDLTDRLKEQADATKSKTTN